MASKKLDGYKGRLSPAEIAEGMNAARANAQRLFADAQTLIDAKRFPTACSLAILAIEEAGKDTILRGLSLARDEKEISACWKDYRSHTKKNVKWIFIQLIAEGARRLEDFLPLFDPSSDHPFVLDQLKQLGFYTDCLGQRHWSIPDEVIDEAFARTLLRIAKSLTTVEYITTPEEMELWVKHLSPVWKSDIASMKQGISNWYAEMQER